MAANTGEFEAWGSVFRQIEALKDRGYKVMLHPFVMMDVPEDNGLPDPHGGEEQAKYPWRGRITCFPGPAQPGTVDKTGAAAGQIAAFFGNAEPGDFSWNGGAETVTYSGPEEWSFRRLVLHYARLAAAAGGVDAFLIGSELIGLSTLRSDADTYPAVAQLKALAADVRAIVGPETRIGYGADWTEYGNHRPTDGSSDVFFHLDPLWSDAAIDFVGIDAYLPLSDWRPGLNHLDAISGVRSPYDRLYLQGNIEGGELFDWYYASQADRDAQIRTPITDGAYGEPWIHRIKDIRSWWLNDHHDRPGGVRNAAPTAWVPRGKPIWLTEFGCPAVDLGPNQPNVFVDPKSSESHLPYYSTGRRDDAIQQSYILAVFDYWQENDNNPHSEIYDGRMVDKDRLYAWTWDARPYPQFPRLESVWADADNWRRGHWLTGRMGGAVLAEDIIVDIAAVAGVPIRVPPLPAVVKGYQIDRIMSPREALEPLFAALDLDAGESDGFVWILPRGGSPIGTFTAADLVAGDGGDFKLVRGQESELPLSVKLGFTDIDRDYRQGAVESRRLRGSSLRVSEVRLPVAIQQSEAREIADRLLRNAHVGRERADIMLPPRALAYDPGDVVALELNGRTTAWRIDSIGFELGRPARLVRCDPDVDPPVEDMPDESEPPLPAVPTTPIVEVMDLPLLSDTDPVPHAPWIAAYADPFLGAALYRSPTGIGFVLDAVAEDPAVIGTLAFDFYSGPVWRWDRVNDLHVDLVPGAVLQSRQEIDVLEGANAAAVRTPSGEWEILQWRDAELVSPGRYRLSMLLRGQRGTEAAMGTPTPAGARFVLLDESLARSRAALGERGRERVERFGPASMPLDDEAFAQRTNTILGIGLRPYAPVQVRGELDHASHDWHIGFVRRTRVDGDGWGAIEVPLAEETEAFRLEILAGEGGAVLRTVELTATSFTYTAAMQIADFGEEQWNFFVRVAQLSRAFGAGTATEALVWDR